MRLRCAFCMRCLSPWCGLRSSLTFQDLPCLRSIPILHPGRFRGCAASIFWFMAFTRTHAAYVRALGQIELIFTFLASVFFFRERVSRTEVIGVILLSGAIVLLVLENAV